MDAYEQIEQIYAKKFKSKKTDGKKSIGDFMIDEHHAVNVKSNNVNKNNYSPNIISASRLLNYLSDENKKLSFIFVNYREVNGKLEIIDDTGLVPVENLSWNCLSIQAQGKGVIQLSGTLEINREQTKAMFMVGFKQALGVYIARERKKLDDMEKRASEI